MSTKQDLLNTVYKQAEAKNNFGPCIGYPYLMFVWQIRHKEDAMKISAIASHKIGKHHWCTTQEECDRIESLIQEYAPSGLLV